MVKRPLLAVLAIIVVSILAIYKIPELSGLRYKEKHPEIPDGSEIILTGAVTDITGTAGNYKLYISDSVVLFGQNSFNFDKVLVYAGDEEKDLLPGCLLCVKGVLNRFNRPVNYGMFDSYTYYHARGFDISVYSDELSFVDGLKNDSGGMLAFSKRQVLIYRVRRALYLFRRNMLNSLLQVFPEEEAGEAAAMLLGEKGYLGDEIKTIYREGGILHILSISGLHITLLGLGLFKVLRFLKRPLAESAAFTVLIMFLYGTMTGFAVSTTRAVFMLFVMMFGRVIGKVYDLLSAMAFSAVILLIIQPLYLFDTGFLLSFTAVFAVGMANSLFRIRDFSGSERIQNLLKKPFFQRIYESIIVCIMIQLMTLPEICCSYYEVPVYSIPVNLLILPLVSFIVLLSLAAGTVGLFWTMGGQFFAGSAYFLFRIVRKVCLTASGLPFSTITTGKMSDVRVLFYYFCFACLIFIMKIRFFSKNSRLINIRCVNNSLLTQIKEFRLLPVTLIFSMLLLIAIPIFRPFYMSVLDVGQGDCIYLESEGKCMLVDCGSSGIKNVFSKMVSPFLKAMGKSRIDYVIITHPDSDHMNGIKELLSDDTFTVGKIGIGIPVGNPELTTEYLEKLNFLNNRDADTEVLNLSAEDRFSIGGISVIVLNPQECYYESSNEASITLLARYEMFSALLMADSEGMGEEHTINQLRKLPEIPTNIDFIKIAHHGSKASTSENLLAAIKPKIAAVSVSKNNRYGHPNENTLERIKKCGADMYRTDKEHQICIFTDKIHDFNR